MISIPIVTLLLKDMLVPTDWTFKQHKALELIALEFFRARRKDHLDDKFAHTFSLPIDLNDSLKDILYKVREFLDSSLLYIYDKTQAVDFYERASAEIIPDETSYNYKVLSDMYYDVSIARYDKGEPTVCTFYLYIGYTLNEFTTKQ